MSLHAALKAQGRESGVRGSTENLSATIGQRRNPSCERAGFPRDKRAFEAVGARPDSPQSAIRADPPSAAPRFLGFRVGIAAFPGTGQRPFQAPAPHPNVGVARYIAVIRQVRRCGRTPRTRPALDVVAPAAGATRARAGITASAAVRSPPWATATRPPDRSDRDCRPGQPYSPPRRCEKTRCDHTGRRGRNLLCAHSRKAT